MRSLSCDWRSSGMTATRRSMPSGRFSATSLAAARASPGRASLRRGWPVAGRTGTAPLRAAAGWAPRARSFSRRLVTAATALSAAADFRVLPEGEEGRFLWPVWPWPVWLCPVWLWPVWLWPWALWLWAVWGLSLRVMCRSASTELPECGAERGQPQGSARQSRVVYLTTAESPNSVLAAAGIAGTHSLYKPMKFLKFMG